MGIRIASAAIAGCLLYAALGTAPAFAEQWTIIATDFPEPPSDFKDTTLKCEIAGQWLIEGKQPVATAPVTIIFSLLKNTDAKRTQIVVKTLSANQGELPPGPSISGLSPSMSFFQVTCSLVCFAWVTDESISVTASDSRAEYSEKLATERVLINRYSGEYSAYKISGQQRLLEKGNCTPYTAAKRF